jgi:hypothetical protein
MHTGRCAHHFPGRMAMIEPAALDDRPALPLPYALILVTELMLLGTMAATTEGRPPLTYELGWVGCGSMVLMQVYSIRRRVRALRDLGALRSWLDLHIFLGLQGFVLVAYHSIGVSPSASLAALNFALVTVVVITGLFGRYLYGMIPRARLDRQRAHAALAADPLPARPCRGLIDLIRLDLARRRALRAIRRDPTLSRARARAAHHAHALAARISALEVAERWCSRWILLHRPLALLLLAITTMHVLAHFAYAA